MIKLKKISLSLFLKIWLKQNRKKLAEWTLRALIEKVYRRRPHDRDPTGYLREIYIDPRPDD
jgi:hypothetical protein